MEEIKYKHLRLKSEMKELRRSVNLSLPLYHGPGIVPLSKTPMSSIPEKKSALSNHK